MSYIQCPIPRNSPSHYSHYDTNSVNNILAMIRNSRQRKVAPDESNKIQFADLPAPAALGKVFKTRKRTIRYVMRTIWTIMDPYKNVLATFKTKKEAIRHFRRKTVPYYFLGKKMGKASSLIKNQDHLDKDNANELVAGSIVLGVTFTVKKGKKVTPGNITIHDSYTRETMQDFAVETKRCDTCPRNKNSMEPNCGCSLLEVIRTENTVQGWQFYTPHALKKMQKYRKKNPPEVIKFSLEDLFKKT